MGRTRSPVLGYNHNVRYHGRIYHVQTEDSGVANPRVFTHLFFSGTIVATKRHDYDALLPEDQVRDMMQGQHKGILKELKRGLYDAKIVMHFNARGEEPFLDQVQVAEALPTDGYADHAEREAAYGEAAQQAYEGEAAAGTTEESLPVAEGFGEVQPEEYPLAADGGYAPAPEQVQPADTTPYQTMVDMPAGIPYEVPMVPAAEMSASAAAGYQNPPDEPFVVLDLDALPPVVDATPEPEAIAALMPTTQMRPTGSGVYVKRGGTAERPFVRPGSSHPILPRPGSSHPTLPRPVTLPPQQQTRPPVFARPQPGPPTRAPVVVVRPPVRQRQPTPAPRPQPGGVVVQRTVVIGAGGPGGLQRPRRPRPAVPYVVKEGSHPLVQNPRAAQVAPAIPSRFSTPAPQAATISDKSLDEVILAYLSQDTDTKR